MQKLNPSYWIFNTTNSDGMAGALIGWAAGEKTEMLSHGAYHGFSDQPVQNTTALHQSNWVIYYLTKFDRCKAGVFWTDIWLWHSYMFRSSSADKHIRSLQTPKSPREM